MSICNLKRTDHTEIFRGYREIIRLGMIVLDSDHVIEVKQITASTDPNAAFRVTGDISADEAAWFWENLEAEDWRSEEGDELGAQLLQSVSLRPVSTVPRPSKR
jgi:hypothetical protein